MCATRRALIARRGLLVLARVAEPRRDGDHAVCACADGSVDHEQQLHQRVVRGDAGDLVAARRLDEEDVGAADGLLVAAVDLAVGEGLELHVAEVDVELRGDLRGELHRAPPAEDHEALGVILRDRADDPGTLFEHAHSVSPSSLASRAFFSA
jgi:hypothetical protein